jgi:branched-chain amino acid transport system ATP-binding protein
VNVGPTTDSDGSRPEIDRSTRGGSDPILAVRDVEMRFGGIRAVDKVSLEIRRGEIVGLIGPNGSGKSTLFNVISGIFPATSGEIHFDGADVTGWKPHHTARRGLARTFQIPALFDNMTVLENLLAASAQDGWEGARERAAEVLRTLLIDHVRDHRAADLSGGQQKLVEFGRVMMRRASLVLLDEVTAGVHLEIRKTILDTVAALRRGGTTFCLIEHDMELVRSVCDRIVVMDAGQVITTGRFEEIASNSEVMQAYLGRRP